MNNRRSISTLTQVILLQLQFIVDFAVWPTLIIIKYCVYTESQQPESKSKIATCSSHILPKEVAIEGVRLLQAPVLPAK